jgi:uncharacterized membrane protein HdeD (DUF308 family)
MVTEANISRADMPHVHWWLILLEGLASFLIGILILAAPGISALALTTLLGAYWFVSGIFSLVSIFTNRMSWGWKLVSGILGVLAGLIVLQYPMFSAILVPAVIGIWLGVDGILIGVMRLVMSYRGAGWGMAILGVVSVLLGFVLLLFPPLAALTAIYAFAFLFLAGGITAFFSGLSLRSRGGEVSVVSIPTPLAPMPVPVTGTAPDEPEAEIEHESEETGEYTGESESPGESSPSGHIPVTGLAPEPFAETEHEGEETGEYSGETGEHGVSDPPGPVPVTGRAPVAPYIEPEHEGEETGEYGGETGPAAGEHKPTQPRKYPEDDEYGEEM